MGSVSQQWMHNLNRRRQVDKMARNIDDMIKKNTIVQYEEKALEAASRSRLSRVLGNIEREQEIERELIVREAFRKQREKEQKDAVLLSAEIQRHHQAAAVDEALRQRVRNDSMDLRSLEAKLRAAYVKKELDAQIVEKKAADYDMLARDEEIRATMEEEMARAEKARKAKEEERRRQRLEVGKTCAQMTDEKVQRDHDLAVAEFRGDRLRVEQVLRQLQETEEQEQRQLRERKDEARRLYWEAYEKQKAAHEAEQENIRQEDERIRQQVKTKGDRDEAVLAKRKAHQDYLHNLSGIIADRIMGEQRKKLEMEDMRLEVHEAHMREAEDRVHEAQREKLRAQKQDLRDAYQEFRNTEIKRKVAETEQQVAIRRTLEAAEAEKELQARKEDEERKRKEKAYAAALREQFAEKLEEFHQRREEERQTVKQLDKDLRRDLIIQEEERTKLLREHVPKLIGYLPKGIFRDEEDAAAFGFKPPKTDPTKAFGGLEF